VALFEMLTGRLPFTASTATEMALKHLQADPPSPLTIRPDLPPALDGVLRTALAKDPAARFRSGEALASAVEAALAGRRYEPSARPGRLGRIVSTAGWCQ
jgi:serine/threonine-protein kinase